VFAELCGSVYGCEYHGVEAFGGDEGYVVLRLEGEGRWWPLGDLFLLGVVVIVCVVGTGPNKCILGLACPFMSLYWL